VEVKYILQSYKIKVLLCCYRLNNCFAVYHYVGIGVVGMVNFGVMENDKILLIEPLEKQSHYKLIKLIGDIEEFNKMITLAFAFKMQPLKINP
jgi:hypothetical protein